MAEKSTTLTEIMALLQGIPEMREMFDLQTSQARRQDPLHAALTQLALNFLPRAGFETNPRRAGMIANLPKYVPTHRIPTRTYDPNDPRSRPQGNPLPGDEMYPDAPNHDDPDDPINQG